MSRMELVLELRSFQLTVGVPVTPINEALSMSESELIEAGAACYAALSQGE